MENLTEEECRTYLKRIQKICICCICSGPLRSPDITECKSGHAICRSCKEHELACEECLGFYGLKKPATLCQIVEAMPRFCRHNHSFIMRDNDNHETWCEFRLVPCFYCRSNVECQAFLDHISDFHNRKPHNMFEVDFERNNFQCNKKLQINVGVTKLLDGHMFNIHYVYFPKDKILRLYVLFWPTRSFDNTTFQITSELFSNDDKVSFTFCQEVTIPANVETAIFDIADSILKNLNQKHVMFNTTISSLEEIKIKVEPSSPKAATISSPDRSSSTSPATTFSSPEHLNQKHVMFNTTISSLEEIKIKVEPSSPKAATISSPDESSSTSSATTFSSPEQSSSPYPAKRFRGYNGE